MSDSKGRGKDNVVRLPVAARPGKAVDGPGTRPIGEEVEALRFALEGLRGEIRSRFPDSCEASGLSSKEASKEASKKTPKSMSKTPFETTLGLASQIAAEVDWLGLFDRLRASAATLGMHDRTDEVDEFGMDAQLLESMRPLFDRLIEFYWRVDVMGRSRLPKQRPCLFVANRSGLVPYDGLMLCHILDGGEDLSARPRFLLADWLIALPFVQPYLARLGGVRACRENADRLLRDGRSVVAFPEGARGATKNYRDRYQLERFGRGGVVRAAIENGVPLIPVGLVGPEETHPVLFKARAPGRAMGLPFLPVTATFPLLGPFGLLPLPSKWVVNIGDAIQYDSEACLGGDGLGLSRATEDLRTRIQALVDGALDRRESAWR